jgi:hypothetical protein
MQDRKGREQIALGSGRWKAVPPNIPDAGILSLGGADVLQDLKLFHFALAIPITPWPTRPPAFPTG